VAQHRLVRRARCYVGHVVSLRQSGRGDRAGDARRVRAERDRRGAAGLLARPHREHRGRDDQHPGRVRGGRGRGAVSRCAAPREGCALLPRRADVAADGRVHGMFGLSIRWEAAAFHALALGAGAWWAKRRLALLSQTLRGEARALAVIAAYAVLLVVWGWRPFLPQTEIGAIAQQLTPAHLVPLASLAQRMDVFSVLHVAQQFLLFLPLGCLLAVWPLRLRGRWSHLWPAVWLAWGIEAGHVVLADRYFDVTNALIACAGLGIGWLALRRSGFARYGEALAPLRRV